MPIDNPYAPDINELKKRLAWIAENINGPYTLSDRAKKRYQKWYKYFHEYQNENPERSGLTSRKSKHLLTLALLIRANQYKAGRTIQLADMEEAEMLLEATYREASEIVDEIQGGEYMSDVNRISLIIRQKGTITRRILTQRGKLKVKILDDILTTLYQLGKIEIRRDGRNRETLSKKITEEYTWIGD